MPLRHADSARAARRLTVALAFSASLIAAIAPARAAPLAEDQLAALMERIGRGGDRRADFTSQKAIAALRQPIVTSGYLVYRRPAYFEKVTTAPRRERVVVDGGSVTIDTGEGTTRTIGLSSQPGLRTLIDTFRGALSGDLALLQRSYAVRGDASGTAWSLSLTPIDGGLQRFIRGVEIRGSGATPRAIAIEQANGDSERLTLSTR